MSQEKPIRVFISYAHESETHRNRVLALSRSLRDKHVDCHVDQYDQHHSDTWPDWIRNEFKIADFVLVVGSETYFRRAEGLEEAGVGLGVIWESALINRDIYQNAAKNNKYIPVIFDPADKENIPTVLQGYHYYSLADGNVEPLLRRLFQVGEVEKSPLGPPPTFTQKKVPTLAELMQGGKSGDGSGETEKNLQTDQGDGSENNVLLLYSTVDDTWAKRAKTHLAPLRRKGLVRSFDLQRDMSGTDKKAGFERALSCAKVVFILLTPAFLADDLICDHQLPRILEENERRGLRPIWLYIKPCNYASSGLAQFNTPFEQYEPYGDRRIALSELPEYDWDRVLVDTTRAIQSILEG